MTAGRPIGERIRTLCEVLDKHGPSGIVNLRDQMPDVERPNLWKYCTRAVGLGLLSVNRDTGHSIFTVAANWRELADQRRTTKQPAPEPRRPLKRLSRWDGISSIFQMGGHYGQ